MTGLHELVTGDTLHITRLLSLNCLPVFPRADCRMYYHEQTPNPFEIENYSSMRRVCTATDSVSAIAVSLEAGDWRDTVEHCKCPLADLA